MIRFALRCTEAEGHAFEGWFRSGEDFDRQRERGLVACAVCGSPNVEKALMRPAVVSSVKAAGSKREAAQATPEAPQAASGAMPPQAAELFAKLQAMSREVRAKADYVGAGFAEEARRIHFGETPERRIYGEASREEVERLADDGIPAFPLPPLPEDKH